MTKGEGKKKKYRNYLGLKIQGKFLVICGLKHLNRNGFTVFTEMQCTQTQKTWCFSTTIVLVGLTCFLSYRFRLFWISLPQVLIFCRAVPKSQSLSREGNPWSFKSTRDRFGKVGKRIPRSAVGNHLTVAFKVKHNKVLVPIAKLYNRVNWLVSTLLNLNQNPH